MNDKKIWRYLSLAKYVDLLRTKSLFFPKASSFQDATEGKWFAHSFRYAQVEIIKRIIANAKRIKAIKEKADNDSHAILLEAQRILATEEKDLNESLKGLLQSICIAYPHKRQEVLDMTITNASKHLNDHGPSLERLKAEVEIYRESTYISCWNQASNMSLAMWEMYGGRESIAICSTKAKLTTLLEQNHELLADLNFAGAVADVQYIDNLKNPDENAQDRIIDIVVAAPDHSVGAFSIKPSVYSFENEVRAIIYQVNELYQPVKDHNPQMLGLPLPIGGNSTSGESSVANFVDAVYVHPLLSEDSMVVKCVDEIHRLFGVGEIKIVADEIEALGPVLNLPADLNI